jgi:mannitol-1-phosphate 5-dehydrogenase
MMKSAVQFGAGNIGRGFMGQLFWEAGYRTVFVDANQPLVNLLNQRGAYTLRLLDAYSKQASDMTIKGFQSLHVADTDKVRNAISEAKVVCTAVGVKSLPLVAALIAEGLDLRRRENGQALDVWLCENAIGAAAILKNNVASHLGGSSYEWFEKRIGFVGTAVARMVPSPRKWEGTNDPLIVVSDAHHELPYDDDAVRGEIPELQGLKARVNFHVEMERKLFTHNLGHAALSYLGDLCGYTYVHESLGDPEISAIFDGALDETALALVRRYPEDILEEEHARVRSDVKVRFGNSMIMDTIRRVAKDPIRKLGPEERLIGSVRLCLSEGVIPKKTAYVCGAAFCYDEPEDPEAVRLQKLIGEKGIAETVREVCGLRPEDELSRMIIKSYHELRCSSRQ